MASDAELLPRLDTLLIKMDDDLAFAIHELQIADLLNALRFPMSRMDCLLRPFHERFKGSGPLATDDLMVIRIVLGSIAVLVRGRYILKLAIEDNGSIPNNLARAQMSKRLQSIVAEQKFRHVHVVTERILPVVDTAYFYGYTAWNSIIVGKQEKFLEDDIARKFIQQHATEKWQKEAVREVIHLAAYGLQRGLHHNIGIRKTDEGSNVQVVIFDMEPFKEFAKYEALVHNPEANRDGRLRSFEITQGLENLRELKSLYRLSPFNHTIFLTEIDRVQAELERRIKA